MKNTIPSRNLSTVLAYLENTYKFTAQAHVEYIANDERGDYCVLDSTIFYPQGGGQPSDVQIRATKIRQEIAKIAEKAINLENYLQDCFSPF